jgi:alpha-amylase
MLPALVLTSVLGLASAATPSQWRSRSIYQVMTDRYARTDGSTTASCPAGYAGFCGGTWKGLANKLDYIAGMGFDAIWISPVVEQINDPSRAYHGYSQQNAYGLNSNFGTASDLKNLASALHQRGMYLMVDVVVNHFGWSGTAESTDYSTLVPFNDKSYFHNVCWITDYNNETNAEECWLGNDDYPLPDVKTDSPQVRNMWNKWIQYMVSTYSIDGLRIDTMRNVEQEFFPGFNRAAGVYCVGEVADGNVPIVCPYQNYADGVLNYPNYYQATEFFSNPSMESTNLVGEVNAMNTDCKDTTLLGSFTENHDQPRFASLTSDYILAKNIITFTFLIDGIPIIYQGQEQHFSGGSDPYDREALWLSGYNTNAQLYQFTKTVNSIRKLAISKSSSYLTWHAQFAYNDPHNLAIRKGVSNSMTLAVLNNLGSSALDYNLTIPSPGFDASTNVVDLLSCTTTKTLTNGSLVAAFRGGNPMVSHTRLKYHEILLSHNF